MTGTRSRFVEPTNVEDEKTRTYLNELVRALRDFDTQIFSTETGTLFRSAQIRPFVVVEEDYQVGKLDSVILVDASVSARTITLPTALELKGVTLDVKKIDDNGSNVVTVLGSGPEFPVSIAGPDRPDYKFFSTGDFYYIL